MVQPESLVSLLYCHSNEVSETGWYKQLVSFFSNKVNYFTYRRYRPRPGVGSVKSVQESGDWTLLYNDSSKGSTPLTPSFLLSEKDQVYRLPLDT